MISISNSRRVSLRKQSLRLQKTKSPKKPDANAYVPTKPMTSVPRSSSSIGHMKKPMRPLTAYHIFFQIEREYIIQNTAGPDADKSIHANKSYMCDVPRRYRCIKLLPDWYAGPGKRRKRKHRKSHGKIGFLELSRVISKRWATLSTTDPETKRFVAMIAARELDEYKLEMKHYKKLEQTMGPRPADVNAGTADAFDARTVISPGGSPTIRPMEVSSSTLPPMMPQLRQPTQYALAETAELVVSFTQKHAASISSSSEDEIDYSICSVNNNGHYIPSPGPASNFNRNFSNTIQPDGTICDPLFELDNGFSFQQPAENRCVSPLSLSSEFNVDNVDIMGDGGFFQLSC
mmetsp:Transcript_26782/g.48582  ORF Transcript_26782/g.48582 Transcript_26782/m.48582 type:complete len:347 (+) Transcript_26782:276-1316(+)